jgi:hypothetical protein
MCRTPAHLPLTCAEHKAATDPETIANEAKSKKWLDSNTMVCVCGRWCEKIDGCDHMTCVRPIGCGAEWCWLCRADYKDIRAHGNRAHKATCRYYK